MGSKRKETSSASAATTPATTSKPPDHPSPTNDVRVAAAAKDTDNALDASTPTKPHSDQKKPQIQLRRSGRHMQIMEDTGNGKRRRTQGEGLGLTSSADSEDSEAVGESRSSVREGVQAAIEGLTRMERRLRRATRRDKIRIKESSFEERMEEQIQEEDAFKPPRPPKKPDVKSASKGRPGGAHGRLLTPEGDMSDSDGDNGRDEDWGPETGVIGGRELEDLVAETPERGAAREPPVNSNYLPLPWTGRLGYACLNTYLRSAKPPVFSSRTCRLASIIDHRHPLEDPSVPEHPTKNRPDKSQGADWALGQKYVQDLGLANARDIVKMLRWNDKYGIKFMRLSSEMFPFASHHEHGYKLASFASEVLAEAGKVAGELGHRLTTHPGQFTQLGSPRKEVVTAAVRDLEYHDEMLSLLHLPEQQNKDAVMILHMGGVFGDKAATLDRFRENYKTRLSPSIKARLVLENDDVSWSVHDLLPICEELGIPLVLDYHHHNIVFDRAQLREGTLDISSPALAERIAATWRRKGITQKMHYSEPCPGAVTPRDRRKHSPRVVTLPPVPPGVDLMIEAKDKEQAVFELMRAFRLPGFERINDMVPHERDDESKPAPKTSKKPKARGKKRKKVGDDEGQDGGVEEAEVQQEVVRKGLEVSAEEFAMGGPWNRVYWPPGMEEWLRPRKKEKKGKVMQGAEEIE